MECLSRDNKAKGRRFAGPVLEGLAVDLDARKRFEVLSRQFGQPGAGLNAEHLEAALGHLAWTCGCSDGIGGPKAVPLPARRNESLFRVPS